LSLRASYCFSFLTFADLLGTGALLSVGDVGVVPVPCEVHAAGCSEARGERIVVRQVRGSRPSAGGR
jgi:hypothetical protein